MSGFYDPERAVARWRLACEALALALADPGGLGGVALHGRHGAARDALLARLGRAARVLRLPPDADEDALEGGVDVTATLAAGRPVRRAGLLDAAPGSALLVGGAERLPARVGARLAARLDAGRVHAVVVALDEGEPPSGFADSALGERLALHVELPPIARAELARAEAEEAAEEAAQDEGRRRQARGDRDDDGPRGAEAVELDDATLAEIVRVAERLGVVSLRSATLACRAARVAAARAGRASVAAEDAALAVQLVLAPRARRAPTIPEDAPPEAPSEARDRTDADEKPETPPPDGTAEARSDRDAPERDGEETAPADGALGERLVAAADAALPPGLLATLGRAAPARAREAGRDADVEDGRARSGRPIGTRRPRGRDERLDLAATLRAAVPWQRLRARATASARVDGGVGSGATVAANGASSLGSGSCLQIRRDDFRVARRRRPTRTTTLFLVDASGSAAAHRLAEAKGALERLLAECYVRRDRVALATFRGSEARLDLAPTRSLARARRALVGLPGGGGTPLASGLDLAAALLARLIADGERPVGVIMSDARANVARDGEASRPRASADAEDAARRLAALGARLLFVDTAPRPRPATAALARLMNARYLPLPAFDGAALAAGGAR